MKRSYYSYTALLLVFMLFQLKARAQQIPMYASYTINPYLISPSFAGDLSTNVNARLLAMSRMQFAGIDGSPVTYLVAGDAPFRSQKMGLGGTVFSDSYGLISQSGASLGYAYHIQLSEETRLSLGLGADLVQHALDFSRIKASDPNENILNLDAARKVTFNGSFGAHIRYQNFLFGFAAPQVYGTQLVQKDYVSNTEVSYQFQRHFMGVMSYRFDVSPEKFALEPMVLMRASAAAASGPQIDINMKALFYKKAFLSLGYRSDYSMSCGGGISVSDYMTIAYSYDLPVNDIAGYTGGSHEFGIAFNLRKSKENVALQQMVEERKKDDEEQQLLKEEINALKEEVAKNEENQEQQLAEINQLKSILEGYSAELEKVVEQNEVRLQKELEAEQQDSIAKEQNGTYYVVIASYKSKEMAIAHQQMLKRNGDSESTYLKQSASKTWFFVYKRSFDQVSDAKNYLERIDNEKTVEIMRPWVYIDNK